MCLSPIQKIFAGFTAERDYKHGTTRRSAAAARHQSKTQLQAGVWGEIIKNNNMKLQIFFHPRAKIPSQTESVRVHKYVPAYEFCRCSAFPRDARSAGLRPRGRS